MKLSILAFILGIGNLGPKHTPLTSGNREIREKIHPYRLAALGLVYSLKVLPRLETMGAKCFLTLPTQTYKTSP